jgi:queuosine precursor transporter
MPVDWIQAVATVMMLYSNELLFVIHTIIISLSALVALYLGSHALVAFVCLQCVLANLFVIKQITLLGLGATCSDIFTIGAVLGLNLLQEYYGAAIAQRTIWINFFLLLFYAVVGQLHLAYLPSGTDTMQPHFMAILDAMPRIVIASFTVYLIAQYCDYLLYGFLKKLFHDRFLVVRNYASIMITQLLDTVLFSFLGLYGLVDNIWQIIMISYSVKLFAIVIATPCIALSKCLVSPTQE